MKKFVGYQDCFQPPQTPSSKHANTAAFGPDNATKSRHESLGQQRPWCQDVMSCNPTSRPDFNFFFGRRKCGGPAGEDWQLPSAHSSGRLRHRAAALRITRPRKSCQSRSVKQPAIGARHKLRPRSMKFIGLSGSCSEMETIIPGAAVHALHLHGVALYTSLADNESFR